MPSLGPRPQGQVPLSADKPHHSILSFSQRAATILRESLEAKVGAFGDFSPEVAETYRVLGRADLAQGNNSGAYAKLKKVNKVGRGGGTDVKHSLQRHALPSLHHTFK